MKLALYWQPSLCCLIAQSWLRAQALLYGILLTSADRTVTPALHAPGFVW
jgi:hypothetical protein